MSFLAISPDMAERLADLYQRMEQAYDLVALRLAFTCQGCPDNCCDSYFLHHTYVEWAYLRMGLRELEPGWRQRIEDRAAEYEAVCKAVLGKDERPQVMCPLNEEGRCILYQHRLMICRMHGVPSSMDFPNGQSKRFPGCFRCQEMVGDQQAAPVVERTPLLWELAALERELLGAQQGRLPKLRKTIAEMILTEPASLL